MKQGYEIPGAMLSEKIRQAKSYIHKNPAWIGALSLSVAVCLTAVFVFSPNGPLSARRTVSGFEAGKVADRDLSADRNLVYVDEVATEAAIRLREAKILPIFSMDEDVKHNALERFDEFRDFTLSQNTSGETFIQTLNTRFPGLFSREDALILRDAKDRPRAFALAESYLVALFDRGIAAIPDRGMERFNGENIEIHFWKEGRLTTEEMQTRNAITMTSWPNALAETGANRVANGSFTAARTIVKAFLTENLFFNRDLSLKHLDSARNEVEPVMKSVSRGEKIIKKGYVVDEAQMVKVRALGANLPGLNLASILGTFGFLLLLFFFGILLMSSPLTGITTGRGDKLALLIFASLYFLLAIVASRLLPTSGGIPFSVILPTGLLVILVALLFNNRAAVVFCFILSLSLLTISDLDAHGSIFAFFSGIAAIMSAQKSEKRIDLVKSGLLLALFQSFLALVLSAFAGRLDDLWPAIFWSAFNGFFCGVLALGFLPILEGLLNAPTRFRLMELSDLNSPLLKRLLTLAPGTYSHSVMVANIAETACRDIKANALLARVAAYYHDIGKMDQPDYFVENQTHYNRHSEIKPRLSATVIRSHVKLGVEKARAMNLPDEVVDIISQHHGDGLISYFYSQALKEDGRADKDDFRYPGEPPKSREAAVVMLADSVEAASRTLKKPTLAKLEQFIEDMIMDKFNQGLLAESELTFRDLKIITNSFVKILAGHFHSRIEYPKIPKEAPTREPSNEGFEAKGSHKQRASRSGGEDS